MPAPDYIDLPSAGTKLSMWLAGPYGDDEYTAIPGATDISWEGFKRGVRNPTHLLSLYVQKKPGMTDLGQVKCKVFYDPNNASHMVIVNKLFETAANASAEIDKFKIEWADGYAVPAALELNGFIAEFSVSATDPETGTVTADMTIEIYNLLSQTEGSGAWIGDP